jgi:hypothetical protein
LDMAHAGHVEGVEANFPGLGHCVVVPFVGPARRGDDFARRAAGRAGLSS